MSVVLLRDWLNANMPPVLRVINGMHPNDAVEFMNCLSGTSSNYSSRSELDACCARWLQWIKTSRGEGGGAAAERARILAAIESVAPMEQPYSRRDWALEQKGAKEHHAKVLRAIQEPKKESHEG